MRLLVVEDEIKLAKSLKTILESESYSVDLAYDGETGYEKVVKGNFDCVLLDVNLPQKDGYSVCKELRRQNIKVPIIMLTARDAITDRVQGLDVGADDYLIKPFAVEELLARLRAHLRRESGDESSLLATDSLTLDTVAKIVKRGNIEILLSAKEYQLLEQLLTDKGQIVPKETLLRRVWGEELDLHSNVVDVYIGYLRKKIDKAFPEEKPLVTTIKGRGYRIGLPT